MISMGKQTAVPVAVGRRCLPTTEVGRRCKRDTVVAGAVEVRAPPELSPPHAEPTSGDSAYRPPLSARGRGRMHAPAPRPAGRRTQRAPHRTGPGRPARALAGRGGWQISPPRRGVAPSLSVRLLAFPQVHLPSPARPPPRSPTWPRQQPTTAPSRPPSPHASHLHVSTRAATDHPPTDCDRPNHVSLQIDYTRPLTLLAQLPVPARWGYVRRRSTCQWVGVSVGSGGERAHVMGTTPGINKLAAEADCPTRGRHPITPASWSPLTSTSSSGWTPRVDRAERDPATRPGLAGTDGPDSPGLDHVATTVPVEALPVTVTGTCPPRLPHSLRARFASRLRCCCCPPAAIAIPFHSRGVGGACFVPATRISEGDGDVARRPGRENLGETTWAVDATYSVRASGGDSHLLTLPMAEICCEEAKSTPATAVAVAAAAAVAVASSALERRRRRLEMRRFRATDLDAPAAEEDLRAGKRQRLARTTSGPCTDGVSGYEKPPPAMPELRLPRYGVTSMEDAVSIRPDFLPGAASKHHFFGVFDGHGCSHVATMCQDRMHEVVADEHSNAASCQETAWKGVMERSFARLDEQALGWATSRSADEPACRCEQQMPSRCDHVGSTAVVAVVNPTHVVVANAGDSRAVLSRGGVPVPLSVDHKVPAGFSRSIMARCASSLLRASIHELDVLDFMLARIEAAGGRVIYWDGARVLGVLAMSRAIGDGYLKPFVSSEPEVTVTERTDDDECLILASDGLWDVVTNEMACDVVRACFRSNGPPGPAARTNGVAPAADADAEDGSAVVKGVSKADSDKACSDAAMLLAKLALARRSADNVSVVVVDLRRGI
ncbi:hypothetical protein HU200_004751 [Digitaria exilis]|uniref:protein-serine/threonine phosphatase n=1 Tax=Digitaria exilis TaxID=1010633 RepID=A0A835FVP4_9POAL|nr:hypothetical protein HU200_004751 [Digitaria exilis]